MKYAGKFVFIRSKQNVNSWSLNKPSILSTFSFLKGLAVREVTTQTYDSHGFVLQF